MVRKMLRAAVAAAVAAMAVVFSFGALSAANKDEKPTIDAIMKQNHNKKAGAFPKIMTLVKEGKFDDAAPLAKKMATNGAKLQTVKPEKGDEKSWETLAKAYGENTQAVSDAVEKKDEAASKKAMGALGGSCKACHDAHRS